MTAEQHANDAGRLQPSGPGAGPSFEVLAGSRAQTEGLAIEDVSHSLGGRQVLDAVRLNATERRIAVIGANGSGKTTLGRCLNGLVVPDAGKVIVDGLDTRTDGSEVRRRVGYVFQNPEHQMVFPIVEEDIGFGLRNQKRPRPEVARAVAEILERFDVSRLAQRPVCELSGGEKRLMSILSVLVMEPRHLVLDEPTTGLDHRQRRQLAAIVETLPQRVVLVTHDFDQIMRFERVIALDHGRVVLDGEPRFVVQRWLDAYA